MMQPYRQILQSLPQHKEVMTLDQCLAAWLDAKKGRSGSTKTETAYRETLSDFRHLLRSVGYDLDAESSIIAPLAQGWANVSKREGETVSASTYNQRLAIVSSFYRYAMKHEVLTDNPIMRVERHVGPKDAAHPIAPSRVKSGLKQIDRSTLEGKRDYAILSIALATGRRVSELANLRYGHIQRQGNTTLIIWQRCKGNKLMTDTLPAKITDALYEYLYAVYGKDLSQVAKESPVWISLSDRNKGQPVSTRTLQRICERYLGTSKMHATRHTCAVTMHNNNATLAEVGKQLGHSNLKTTSDYLEQHLSHTTKYASLLEDAFGI